jgi:hypothetical protein
MSETSVPAIDPNLVSRVKNLLTRPRFEWPVIEDEYATTETLFRNYAVLLAAIGPIAGLLGGIAFGDDKSLLGMLVGGALGYVASLVVTFIMGYVIDALASSFGGTPNRLQAMKVAVYSTTASWIAGIGGLIPVLGGLIGLIGFGFSVFLLFLGLRQLMKAPQDKIVLYTVVTVIALIVVAMICFAIVAAIVGITVGGAVGLAAISSL